MINKFGIATTALAAGMAFGFANAAAAEGMYGSLMGGYSFFQDSTLSGERDDLNNSTDAIKLDDSFIVGGAIGYSFKEPWRLEGEVTYQKFDVDQIINTAGTFVTGNGDIGVIGFGVNGVYEYRQSGSSLTPYIGVGAGAIYADANNVQRPGRSTLNESAFAPTGQVLLGVDYDLDKSVALTAGYRLQGIGYLDGSNTRSNGSNISGDADFILIHNVTAGLRFKF